MAGESFNPLITDEVSMYTPGTILWTDGGLAYHYVWAQETIPTHAFALIYESDKSYLLDRDRATVRGHFAGAAATAIPSGYYGWILVKGYGLGLLLASVARGARLQMQDTANTGYLSDTTDSGQEYIDNVFAATIHGGSNSAGLCSFNFPVIGPNA